MPEITLDQLKEQKAKKLEKMEAVEKPNLADMETAAPSQILPTVDPFAAQTQAKKEVADEINAAIDAKISRIEETAEALKAKMEEALEEQEIEESLVNQVKEEAELEKELEEVGATIEAETATDPAKASIEMTTTSYSIDSDDLNDKDLDDLEKELEEDELDTDAEALLEKQRAQYSELVKKNIKPITNVIDLSSFKVSGKEVSVSKVASTTPIVQVSDWVLPHTGRVISMKAFCGDDIDKLANQSRNRTAFNNAQETYQLIYDHIMDEDKPDTMEEWLKSIDFYDLSHLYFAIYKATFERNNYVPYICPNKECSEVFMPEIGIKDMVKYKNDEDKKYVESIFTGNRKATPESELLQISDTIAIAFRTPTLYNITFENLILDEATRTRYNNILAIISYIENIYEIDMATHTLNPIAYKKYPNDKAKTTKSKLITYTKVFKTLTSDQKGLIDAHIAGISEKAAMLTYVLPEVTCPKCNAKVEEEERDATSMLFTRHRLATIVI